MIKLRDFFKLLTYTDLDRKLLIFGKLHQTLFSTNLIDCTHTQQNILE